MVPVGCHQIFDTSSNNGARGQKQNQKIVELPIEKKSRFLYGIFLVGLRQDKVTKGPYPLNIIV